MAKIVIDDLPENDDLDAEAMRSILGGQRSPNLGLRNRRQSLILDRFNQPGALLPQIGLGGGFLGSQKLS